MGLGNYRIFPIPVPCGDFNENYGEEILKTNSISEIVEKYNSL